MSDPTPPTRKSLYEYLGPHLLDALVDRLYDRICMDVRLAPFFAHMDMSRLRVRMKEFLAFATGGPTRYRGSDMRAAHTIPVAMGMKEEHFDMVVDALLIELKEFGIPNDRLAEVTQLVESVRRDVLNT